MLSAVVADGMKGDRYNPNVELVAQGLANIASPLFGGIPASGMGHAATLDLDTFSKGLRSSGRTLILCGAMQQPSKPLRGRAFS